jgi:hypothetical protein
MPQPTERSPEGSGWRRIACLLALVALGDVCRAHDRLSLTPSMGRPATERKHFLGDQHRRAGCPQSISVLARSSESAPEIGYFVGGGAPQRSRHAQCRTPQEGIWGTDYAGLLVPKHVALGWWHGQRSQGGTGAYATDGPVPLRRP